MEAVGLRPVTEEEDDDDEEAKKEANEDAKEGTATSPLVGEFPCGGGGGGSRDILRLGCVFCPT